MAEFEKAIGFVLTWEGGYVNDPDDSGGETYRGISRKHNPQWEGWRLVDMRTPLRRGAIIKNTLLEEMVKTYYYKKYWFGMMGDKISDQRFAGFFLDWYVHSSGVATKKLQDMLGLKADGVIGPVTLAAINKAENLFTRYRERRIQFYKDHCRVVPKDQKHLKGWLNRVNDYPTL